MEMTRPLFIGAGIATSSALCLVALYAALFVGHQCGDETVRPPSPGSLKATYCDFWTHPDDRVTLAIGVLFYGPVVAPIVGGVWTSWSGRASVYWQTTAAAFAIFAVHVCLAVALPS